MEKKTYVIPSMKAIGLRHRERILVSSRQTPPEEIKDYDDWLSAKESYALFEEDEEE
jgi:hypothetical protein